MSVPRIRAPPGTAGQSVGIETDILTESRGAHFREPDPSLRGLGDAPATQSKKITSDLEIRPNRNRGMP